MRRSRAPQRGTNVGRAPCAEHASATAILSPNADLAGGGLRTTSTTPTGLPPRQKGVCEKITNQPTETLVRHSDHPQVIDSKIGLAEKGRYGLACRGRENLVCCATCWTSR